MKITRIRLGRLRVPLKTQFKTALRTVTEIDDIIVVIDTDSGHVGYGEAPPTAAITGETHGSIIDAIRHYIAPRLIGIEIDDREHMRSLIDSALARNTSAKAAVDIAVHDLLAQHRGVPLYQLLGGGVPEICTDLTISVNPIEQMVADAASAVARGFTALKIKLGKDIAVDIDRVKAIHAAVGGRARLRLDANQGWTPEQTVQALRTIEAGGIELELIEQPVPAHDIAGLRYVRERVATPVMADESVYSPREALALIEAQAADIINIKLMKSGGIAHAIEIADIAGAHGLQCMIGCMLETGLSVAAAVHVAIARSDVITKVDLDGPALGQFNPVESGVDFNDARISVSMAPGLGVTAIHGLEMLDA